VLFKYPIMDVWSKGALEFVCWLDMLVVSRRLLLTSFLLVVTNI
jgi:hypothetical protein